MPFPTYIRVATLAAPNVSFAVAPGLPLGGNPPLPVPVAFPPNTVFIFVDIAGAVAAGIPGAVAIGNAIKCNLNAVPGIAAPAAGPFPATLAGIAAEAGATIAQVAATNAAVAAGGVPPAAFIPLFGGGAAASAVAPQPAGIIAIRISTAPGGAAPVSISMYPI
jgi:hypothetical protein